MNLYLAVTLLLGSASQRTLGQPINSEDYLEITGHFFEGSRGGQSTLCYNEVFAGTSGTRTTAQYLAMFTDKFVEHNGRVFAVKNDGGTGGYEYGYNTWPYDEEPNGLYEVHDDGHGSSCITFQLLFENDNIGQIIASSQFDSYELIIGVDQVTNRIWGYYEQGGVWLRKRTVWGYAIDGSLTVDPTNHHLPSGLSLNGRLFNIWGEFPGNFNYAKHDGVHCSSKPAIIDDWSGFWAGSRGVYCPGEGDNKLWKYTWHSATNGGQQVDKLGWKSASKIARLGPKSNIFGISPHGELVMLWDEKGVAVHCASIGGLPSTQGVQAVGGLDDGYARGVFVSSSGSGFEERVYNVFWDGGWKQAEIDIDYGDGTSWATSAYFGNHEGKTYLLYITQQYCQWVDGAIPHCDFGMEDPFYYGLDLYRLDFIGGSERYKAELLASGSQGPKPF